MRNGTASLRHTLTVAENQNGSECQDGTNSRQPAKCQAPVAHGDVFEYFDTGRVATVICVIPGGIVEIRIEGYIDGRQSQRIGRDFVGEVKSWKRLGRAEYRDGVYLSAMHLAKRGEGT